METTTKFELDGLRVGDKVKGTHSAPYLFTDHNMTLGEVVKVHDDGEFDVKVLEFVPDEGLEKGEIYRELAPRHFEVVEQQIKVGDLVAGKPGQRHYGITTGRMNKAEVTGVDVDKEISIKVVDHEEKSFNGDTFSCLRPEYFVRLAKEEPVEEEEASKFRKGDIVAPNDATLGKYQYTRKGVMTEGEVVLVYSADRMRVKITKSSQTVKIGREYDVDQHRFDKVVKGLKVGDIVKPNDKTIGMYSITRKGRMAEGKVTEVMPSWIRVEVTKMESGNGWVGQSFVLDPEAFDLVTPEEAATPVKNPFKVGDRVQALPKSDDRYSVTNTKMLEAEVVEVISATRFKIQVNKHTDTSLQELKFIVDVEYFRKQEFSVGDIIAGTPEASKRYLITTEGLTKAEVLEIREDGKIIINALEFRGEAAKTPMKYTVSPGYFKLVQTVKQVEEAKKAEAAAKPKVELVFDTTPKVTTVPAGVVSMTGDEHELCVELADGTEIHGSPASVVDFMERMKKSVEAGRL